MRCVLVVRLSDLLIQSITGHWYKVTDQHLLLVLVASNKGNVLPDKGMLAEMCIYFSQLDTKASNLDLVISTTSAFDLTVCIVPPEVACAIHTITNALPELSFWAWLSVGRRGNRVFPLDFFHGEPVVYKFLCG